MCTGERERVCIMFIKCLEHSILLSCDFENHKSASKKYGW